MILKKKLNNLGFDISGLIYVDQACATPQTNIKNKKSAL
jgi:hypothetical protein